MRSLPKMSHFGAPFRVALQNFRHIKFVSKTNSFVLVSTKQEIGKIIKTSGINPMG
jgi:hypothetical protein